MKIITIGREFASGGREVGKRLADQLGIAYYDREIITEIAKQSELDERYVEHVLESGMPSGSFLTFGQTLATATMITAHPATSVISLQKKVIRQLATRDCVIVGRCADLILSDLNPFKIFVYADEKSKIERCRKRAPEDERLTDKQLLKKIRKIDKGRKKLHSLYLGKDWGDREGYNLCVNTSGTVIKEIVPCIASYVEHWFENR
ncbi:MAG: cytidylate kinase-like family protein [Clostridia bacterium]|nr:cytidylate kinase-like family protein [Clostridia bacterium]